MKPKRSRAATGSQAATVAASQAATVAASQEAIVVLGGSFSPLHMGHLAALEAGRRDAERRGIKVVAGYLVPALDTWLAAKLAGRGEVVSQQLALSEAVRLRMVNETAAQTDWILPVSRVLYSARKFGEAVVASRHARGTKILVINGGQLPSLIKDRRGNELSSTYRSTRVAARPSADSPRTEHCRPQRGAFSRS